MSPAPPVPGSKGSLSKWLTGHKWEAGLGVAGVGVTVYLAYRSRQSSSTSGTSSSTSPSSALPTSYYPAGSGGGDGFASEISSQLSTLSDELTAAGGSSSPGTPPTGQVLEGAGYGSSSSAPVSSSGGGASYSPIENQSQLAALGAGGIPIYWQTSPGVFAPTTPGMSLAGIPTYQLASGTAGK